MQPPYIRNSYDTALDAVVDPHVRGLLSGTAPISYNSGTGVISMSVPISVADGGTGVATFGGVNTVLFTTAAGVLSSSANLTYDGLKLTTNGILFSPAVGLGTRVLSTNNSGTVSTLQLSSPLGSGLGFLGIQSAKADSSTLGACTFTAADFNDNGAGLISIDYVNGQAATSLQPGFLSSTDWTTFNNKQPALGNFTTGQALFGQGTSIPLTDTNFFWDNTAKALCISTNVQLGAFTVVGIAGTTGAAGGVGQVGCNIAAGTGGVSTSGIAGVGGAVTLAAGKGGTPAGGTRGGAGGALNASAGDGGAGGSAFGGAGGAVNLKSGNAGAAVTGAGQNGGAFNNTAGNGGSSPTASAGGYGGSFSLNGGFGGVNSSSGVGGNGGNAFQTAGPGGANTGSGNGGPGGTARLLAGAGGNTPAAAGTPGAGGIANLIGGNSGTSADAVKGNNGGQVNVTGGTGSATGNGGDVVVDGGIAGASGTAGNVKLASLQGKVAVGAVAPTALLHIAAGTAAAGTAPLKFVAGTLLAALELGALEFVDNGVTSHLYITVNIAGVLTRVMIV